MKPATPEQFLKYANFFFYTVGIKSYDRKDAKANFSPITWIFFISFSNVTLIASCLVAFVVDAAKNKQNFEAAIITSSHISFGFIGLSKMAYIYSKRKQMTIYIQNLDELFPKTLQQQNEYELPKYLKLCTNVSFGFSMVYMAHTWIQNLYNIVMYLIANRLLHISNAEKQLPYLTLIPWDYKDNWSFYVIYIASAIGGYTSAAGQIASDLLLFSTASQVLMHYDYISRSIENYVLKNIETKGKGNKQAKDKDISFLGEMIVYHEKIFGLSDLMNQVFGVPLFLNFFSSALVICTLAFQATIGIPPEQMIRIPMFIFMTLMQTFLISYYGQALMDASENIADAVYNHNWNNADLRYQKMLVLIVQRAQRPAILKATTLLNLSRGTMTDVLFEDVISALCNFANNVLELRRKVHNQDVFCNKMKQTLVK